MMNVRSFRKEIREMKQGDICYIDAIGLSLNSIDELRNYIKVAILAPYMPELRKTIKAEYLEQYLNGTSICPQMTYIKL